MIVVENLKHIRTHAKQRGAGSRRRLHLWAFAQLRSFLEYKAEGKECVVVGIDPHTTPHKCARVVSIPTDTIAKHNQVLCAEIGLRTERQAKGGL